MWSSAQIDKATTSVRSDFAPIRDLSWDQGNLEWVTTEKSKSFFFAQDQTGEGLSRRNNFLSSLFNIFVVLFLENINSSVRIIEKSFLSWWAMTKLHSIFILKSLTQDVSRWMPESFFSFFVLKFNEFEVTVSFEWSAYIPEIPLVVCINTCFCFWI